MAQRVVYLALGDLEGKVAMKIKIKEHGQSVALFAILMPIMSLFLLGILDYMVTNARVMETVAAADLVILVQNHRSYDAERLAAAARLFLDTRGVTDGDGRL